MVACGGDILHGLVVKCEGRFEIMLKAAIPCTLIFCTLLAGCSRPGDAPSRLLRSFLNVEGAYVYQGDKALTFLTEDSVSEVVDFYLERFEETGVALEADSSNTRQPAVGGREFYVLQGRSAAEGAGGFLVQISMVQLPEGFSQVFGTWKMSVDSAATETSQEVSELIGILETGGATERKDAVMALGEMGPAAAEALPGLFWALMGENAFTGAFEGTFVNELATAIASIAQGDAVSRCEPLFELEGELGANNYTIFCQSALLPKVGEEAVPGLAEILVTREAMSVRRAAAGTLGWMAEYCLLGDADRLAAGALRVAASHDPSEQIREIAQDVLAKMAKCRR